MTENTKLRSNVLFTKFRMDKLNGVSVQTLINDLKKSVKSMPMLTRWCLFRGNPGKIAKINSLMGTLRYAHSAECSSGG